MTKGPYVFDTNAFSQLRSYFPKQFPSFWRHLGELADAGRVVSVREVRRELEGRPHPDWLEDWLESRSSMFLTPGPEETRFVGQIFQVPHFQALVGSVSILRGTPAADPFIIAAAKVANGCVVTQEPLKPNAAKIPNVCVYFAIPWLSFEGFMAENGWSY